MRAFFEGNESAFEELWQWLLGPLRRYLQRSGIPRDSLDDISQEVAVRLYLTRERRAFTVGQPVRPWVYRVARHLVVEHWRLQGRRPGLVSLDDVAEPAAPPGEDTGRDVERAVTACVGSLPPDQREYILLCGKHGLGQLSHNEIAEVLDLWPSQVSIRSRKALQSLRLCAERRLYGKGAILEGTRR